MTASAPGTARGRLRLFASLETATTTWRTWRRRGNPGWTTTPRTWPRTGTLRAGHACELTTPRGQGRKRPAARQPVLMPTPTAADGTGGPGTSPKRTGGPNLRTLVTTLPLTSREKP
ncbi:hypothetical protein ACWCZ5_12310 [Streptomyces sp. NPDC001667]